jgi:hypothetical protein
VVLGVEALSSDDEALAYREDYLATRRIVLPMGIAKDRKKS